MELILLWEGARDLHRNEAWFRGGQPSALAEMCGGWDLWDARLHDFSVNQATRPHPTITSETSIAFSSTSITTREDKLYAPQIVPRMIVKSPGFHQSQLVVDGQPSKRTALGVLRQGQHMWYAFNQIFNVCW